MNIIEATKDYEAWLEKITPLSNADMRLKHQRMREDFFCCLRATYYRWAQLWPVVCPTLAKDVPVLAVGDLHVENFGTWRDSEGRLVWGVNDFDECHPLPFSNDLVRLAVSVWLAIETGEMSIAPNKASAAILEGYRACLKAGGRPLVLADKVTPLRTMMRHRLSMPEKFWNKMHSYPALKTSVPKKIRRVIQEILPHEDVTLKFVDRVAGLGSLGKQRFTALGTWGGGQIAREAKALTLSACCWAEGKKGDGKIHYDKILRRAVRCRDPLVMVCGDWLARRLSEDCFRISLSHLPEKRNEFDLLYFMGWEAANIHLGSVDPAKLTKHLKRKSAGWLHQAATVMREECLRDWKRWKKNQ
jgi:uncharacterized protein (DUF2252 family)